MVALEAQYFAKPFEFQYKQGSLTPIRCASKVGRGSGSQFSRSFASFALSNDQGENASESAQDVPNIPPAVAVVKTSTSSDEIPVVSEPNLEVATALDHLAFVDSKTARVEASYVTEELEEGQVKEMVKFELRTHDKEAVDHEAERKMLVGGAHGINWERPERKPRLTVISSSFTKRDHWIVEQCPTSVKIIILIQSTNPRSARSAFTTVGHDDWKPARLAGPGFKLVDLPLVDLFEPTRFARCCGWPGVGVLAKASIARCWNTQFDQFGWHVEDRLAGPLPALWQAGLAGPLSSSLVCPFVDTVGPPGCKLVDPSKLWCIAIERVKDLGERSSRGDSLVSG
ncbi:hypothetical protein BJ742DRAFT_738637 [Cladochytrium replicatum]|nr:hypothetical protein BJ742DRAFT_738637 [Cladochytrium replicatum]